MSSTPGSSELRTAADKDFVDWWTKEGFGIDPDFEDVPWYDKRQGLAAEAFIAGRLSNFPADDGEPITEGWLRQCGFTDDEDQLYPELTHLRINPLIRSTCKETGEVTWWISAYRDLPTPPDRGSLRRLCAALGVPLTESKLTAGGS